MNRKQWKDSPKVTELATSVTKRKVDLQGKPKLYMTPLTTLLTAGPQ
jgi:hypothetical protein